MNLLKSLILATGLNQKEFATKVNKKPSHINRDIKEGGNMKFSTLREFAEICGIKKLEIIEGQKKVTINFKHIQK